MATISYIVRALSCNWGPLIRVYSRSGIAKHNCTILRDLNIIGKRHVRLIKITDSRNQKKLCGRVV